MSFISYLVKKKVIPKESESVFRTLADYDIKDFLVEQKILDKSTAKFYWNEYVREHGKVKETK